MKIVFWGNDSGSKFWRLIDPSIFMSQKGFDCITTNNGISEKWAKWADVFVLQSCTDKDGIALLRQYQVEHGKKIVVEIDDALEVNEDNPHLYERTKYEASFVISQTMKIADMVTTTTDTLAKEVSKFNSNVKVLPNYMNMKRWDTPIYRNETDRIRIGWAGSLTHLEDLKLVINPLKRLCAEYPIDLVFVGDPRVGKLFDGCSVDNQLGVPFEVWPIKLHTLRLDMGIAPLRDTPFNRCKTDIKWMEYGICKVPTVASPTIYEKTIKDGVDGMIARTEEEWYLKLKELIESKNKRTNMGDAANRRIHSEFDLEKNIGKWTDAFNSLIDNK